MNNEYLGCTVSVLTFWGGGGGVLHQIFGSGVQQAIKILNPIREGVGIIPADSESLKEICQWNVILLSKNCHLPQSFTCSNIDRKFIY